MGFALAGFMLVSKFAVAGMVAPENQKGKPKKVRIRPIEGMKYSASFLAFADRARFENPRDAVASVRDRRICYDIVYDGE